MLQVAAMSRASGPPLEGSSLKKIRKLDRIFRKFREIEDTMPLTMAHALLAVGLNEGKSLQEIAQTTGISMSNFSRYLLALADRSRTGGPGTGYGLVIREQDPTNLRKNSYFLSEKGKMFFRDLLELI